MERKVQIVCASTMDELERKINRLTYYFKIIQISYSNKNAYAPFSCAILYEEKE